VPTANPKGYPSDCLEKLQPTTESNQNSTELPKSAATLAKPETAPLRKIRRSLLLPIASHCSSEAITWFPFWATANTKCQQCIPKGNPCKCLGKLCFARGNPIEANGKSFKSNWSAEANPLLQKETPKVSNGSHCKPLLPKADIWISF